MRSPDTQRRPASSVGDPVRAEAALRERALAGDRGATAELLDGHLDTLYEFVHYRVGRDAARAEDVVQETLLVAFDPRVAFDGRSSFHTWLCGIAKNKIRAERRKRRPVRLEDLLDESDADIDRILADVESEPLPDEALEARETADLVGATMSSLPPTYRRALVAKYVDGSTVPEMALAEGRHVKAVESHLLRARTAFTRVFTLLARRRGDLP